MIKPTSLKMRAISLLSHREHSRVELRRKLLNILRSQQLAVDRAARLNSPPGADATARFAGAASGPWSGSASAAPPTWSDRADVDDVGDDNNDSDDPGGTDSAAEAAGGDHPSSAAAEVDDLLQSLQEQGYLDEARFIDSRVHARARRFGSLRIKQELAQHGLSLSAENQAELKSTEFERARAVWQRKFDGQAPDDAAARAKQVRFLMARGFGSDVIRRVLRGDEE
jgi:regulatory protein